METETEITDVYICKGNSLEHVSQLYKRFGK